LLGGRRIIKNKRAELGGASAQARASHPWGAGQHRLRVPAAAGLADLLRAGALDGGELLQRGALLLAVGGDDAAGSKVCGLPDESHDVCSALNGGCPV